MRTVLIAASAVAALLAGEAEAQRMVGHGPGGMAPMIGAGYAMPGTSHVGMATATATAHSARWGSNVGGRWWAGANAPGGWGTYHRAARGWTLPGYWIAPSFAIADWSTYGLGEPPAGYGWSRYYDDAVLVDGRGRVYDCVNGVDWNRGGYDAGDAGGYAGSDAVYAGPGDRGDYAPPPPYAQHSPYAQTSPYAQQSPYTATAGYAPDYPPAYAERRNSGVGGALVGAAAGGVAGNLIAGRGNRLAGTLIGAGVGGAAGYAIDRSRTHRVPVAPGAPYGYPSAAGDAPAYPPAPGYAPPPPSVGPAGVWHGAGGTTVTTSTTGGGYCCGGGATTTVVTVQSAPLVTTTTTEIVEDAVTYRRHVRPARHKWVRRATCRCN